MEKRQLPDGPNARQRNYLIGRLRKAVKWATLFAELCAIKGDSRMSLEAEVCFYIHSIVVVVYEYFCLELQTHFNLQSITSLFA